MNNKYRSMTFTRPAVPLQQVTPQTTFTPAHLPRPLRATIALIDVDNIALAGRGRLDRKAATAALAEVYAQLSGVEISLAVASHAAIVRLGGTPWFDFSRWTWRAAEVGPDAADHQLIDFARSALRQRPRAIVAVASGDHLFAELAIDNEIEVVVPRGHHGVARTLRPHLRVRGGFDLAT